MTRCEESTESYGMSMIMDILERTTRLTVTTIDHPEYTQESELKEEIVGYPKCSLARSDTLYELSIVVEYTYMLYLLREESHES
jgi:hypothetical protein